MNPRVWSIATLVLLGCGCGGATGNFDVNGYRHAKYAYAVPYAAPATKSVLGPDWSLDNYYGSIDSPSPKTGADYEATLYVDTDGDGEADDLGTQFTYDLRFTHNKTSGVIWLRTLPLERSLEQKDLRVLARSFESAMSGTHYETVQLQGNLVRVAQERTYAIEELDTAEGTIAERPAFRTNLNVVDVDQLKVNPAARQEKVQLVIVKSPFRLVKVAGVRTVYDLPVLLIVGLAAHVDDFETVRPDFEAFLQRLTIANKQGVAFGASAASTTPVVAADATATPAAQVGEQATPVPGTQPVGNAPPN